MPSQPREHPVKEAARGIALLTGLAVMTVGAGFIIAAITVALIG